MNEDLKYRKAEPADAERIMEIIRQAQAQMRALGSLQWQDGYPARTDIDNDIARGYGYVFEKSGTAEEPAAAGTPQKCDKGRASGAVIAYGAVVFDGEPAYGAIDGAWLTGGDYVVLHRLAVADGVHAPHRSAGPRTGRRQFQGGHQFRQPLHAADARTAGIRLLRQNRLRKR